MLFSKKVEESKFLNFQKSIKKSFDKIKYEVNLSYKWITNLNNRVSQIESNDANDFKLNELIKDLNNLKKENKNLILKNDELKNINSQLYSKLNEVIVYLHKIDPKINRMQKIESDIDQRFREFKDNQENFLKDDRARFVNNNDRKIEYNLSFEKIYKILESQNDKISKIIDFQLSSNKKNSIVSKVVDVDTFKSKKESNLNLNLLDVKLSKSEKLLLYSLLNSKKELSYIELSNSTGLNYGTIKNIMYNFRKKNIDIPFILNDKKEKLYYLDNDLILKITGK